LLVFQQKIAAKATTMTQLSLVSSQNSLVAKSNQKAAIHA
jgi:hypothetical protein